MQSHHFQTFFLHISTSYCNMRSTFLIILRNGTNLEVKTGVREWTHLLSVGFVVHVFLVKYDHWVFVGVVEVGAEQPWRPRVRLKDRRLQQQDHSGLGLVDRPSGQQATKSTAFLVALHSIRYDTLRYGRLTYAQKLTTWPASLAHGIEKIRGK